MNMYFFGLRSQNSQFFFGPVDTESTENMRKLGWDPVDINLYPAAL